MHAIEIEVVPEQRQIRLPKVVPDGVTLRVVFMWESPAEDDESLKRLIASVPEGLTDEDLARGRDLGRGDQEWAI